METYNITRLKHTMEGKVSLTGMSLDRLIEQMRSDDSKNNIAEFRRYVKAKERECGLYSRWLEEYAFDYRIPSFLPSADIKIDKDGNEVMKKFNGIITLTVSHAFTPADQETVKRTAAILPMTYAAFIGSTGMSVKILVRVEQKDGTLPATAVEAEAFCKRAYEVATRVYDSIIAQNVQMAATAREGQSLYSGFRRTIDPNPYINRKAVPMLVDEIRQGKITPPVQDLHDRQFTGEDGFDNESDSQIRKMLEYLKSRYDFRYNMVERVSEMRIRNKTNYGWLPLDEQRFNSIMLDLQSSGIRVWDKDFNRYLHSMKVEVYDPIQDYLYNVEGKWDGKDHIGRLAGMVPTKCAKWKTWFRKWFLSMVAQWLGYDRRYGNSIAPLLISRQGYNKSTFCRLILPPELRHTYIDNLDVAEKKATLIAMAQSMLINLDEFNAISPKIQQGFLKNVMQLPTVKVKLPYARTIESIPRRASFIATTNMTDILADPSGCRRFIGIELSAPIDVTSPINYDQLYAQAVTAIKRRERYWFDQEETEELIAHNRRYQVLSPAEQYFRLCFEITQNPEEGEFMTTAAIFDRVKKAAGATLQVNSLKSFGRFLCNIEGIVKKRTNAGTCYLVKPL